MQRIQDLFEQLRGMFPDKESMKKKFGAIEKNIKNLFDMLIAQQTKQPEEDSGMFTKRYVGPANCASCEKNITNLLAQPADYTAWKRLPFREPSERIARYGQGFSKILTMMKPSESTGAMYEAQGQRPFNQTQNAQFSEQKMPRGFDEELGQSPDFLSTTMSPQRQRGGRNGTDFATADDATT